MDGIEGIAGLFAGLADLAVAFVELIVVGVQLVACVFSFLFELLIWGILAIRGKKGEKPEFSMPSKKRVVKKSLIIIGVLVVAGGYFLHQSFFSARISFTSSFTSEFIYNSSPNVKYELRSESGRTCAMEGAANYLTYRWDSIVITDERFEPETYSLTKEDKRISLKSVEVDKVKEELVDGIKSCLLDAAKDKLNSALEKE